MFNIAKPGSLGGGCKIWTNKKLQEEANKYKTRGEFWTESKIASVITHIFIKIKPIFLLTLCL